MTLKNDSTEAARNIWKQVDEAARQAPEWVRERVNRITAERAADLSRDREKQKPAA